MLIIRQFFLYLLATISINVQAQVLVDTGPSDGNFALSIYHNSNQDYQKLAGNFVLQSSYSVTNIYASVIYYDFWSIKPEAVINVSVHNDKNNQPGESLFSSQLTIPATTLISLNPPDQIFVPRPVELIGLKDISLSLNSGSYWIVFSGVQGEPSVGWGASAINPLSSYMVMNSSNEPPPFGLPFESAHTWTEIWTGIISPGLKILGTPLAVPEPENSGMLLAGLGLLGIAARRVK